jgi:hypothetical protein
MRAAAIAIAIFALLVFHLATNNGAWVRGITEFVDHARDHIQVALGG